MLTAVVVSHRRTARIGFRLVWLLGLFLASGAVVRAQFEFPTGLPGLGRGTDSQDVKIEAEFTPAKADRPALLFVTAKIPPGFHVYAVDQGMLPDNGGGPMATVINVDADAAVRVIGPWQAVEPPRSHEDQEIWVGLELREHEGQVTWFAPISIVPGTDVSGLSIDGMVEGQACNPQTCIPFEQSFTAKLGTGVPLPSGVNLPIYTSKMQENSLRTDPTADLAADSQPIGEVAQITDSGTSYDLSRVSIEQSKDQSFVYYLITAFLGGLILNIMPCVLPVIGLKVMSFVQQAGQSRAHAWALNCWYAAGIVSVFLILASLAVSIQLGWGGQFSNAKFNITLIGIVFAMALSLLGLWEIPIPGFVGGGTAMKAAEQEGPAAAFLKGVLTTLLATPCTGPFMATALAWAVKQPAWMTYSTFAVLGLGMASPYLLIGAFPNLIRFLPKPGAWMESFKKIMGLVLLATVVWLMTFIDAPLAVPTVLMMVGIAAACWWVSQTPVTSSAMDKFYAWTTAGLLVVVAALGSYGWLYQSVMLPRFEKMVAAHAEQQIALQRLELAQTLQQVESPDELGQVIEYLAKDDGDQPWQPFSLAKLGQFTLGEGRTVLVDFTADWCLTCKTLEKFVLKTEDVENALTEANVLTMEADYTKKPPAIDRAIKALGGVGVPLIAIFPAADPYHPIVFSNASYTKAQLIDAIAQATGQDVSLSRSSGTNKTSLTQAAEGEPRL